MDVFLDSTWVSRSERQGDCDPYDDGAVIDFVLAATDEDVEAVHAGDVRGAKRQRRLSGYENFQIVMGVANLVDYRVECDLPDALLPNAPQICTGSTLDEQTAMGCLVTEAEDAERVAKVTADSTCAGAQHALGGAGSKALTDQTAVSNVGPEWPIVHNGLLGSPVAVTRASGTKEVTGRRGGVGARRDDREQGSCRLWRLPVPPRVPSTSTANG